jgi:hypothetical protein
MKMKIQIAMCMATKLVPDAVGTAIEAPGSL